MQLDRASYFARLRSLGVTDLAWYEGNDHPRPAPLDASVTADAERREAEAREANAQRLAATSAIDARTATPEQIAERARALGAVDVTATTFYDPRNHANPTVTPQRLGMTPAQLRAEAMGEAQQSLLAKLEAAKAAGRPVDARTLTDLEHQIYIALRGFTPWAHGTE